jgi:hypothetical protein
MYLSLVIWLVFLLTPLQLNLSSTPKQMEVLLHKAIIPSPVNIQPVASHWQPLSHNVITGAPRHQRDSNS